MMTLGTGGVGSVVLPYQPDYVAGRKRHSGSPVVAPWYMNYRLDENRSEGLATFTKV